MLCRKSSKNLASPTDLTFLDGFTRTLTRGRTHRVHPFAKQKELGSYTSMLCSEPCLRVAKELFAHQAFSIRRGRKGGETEAKPVLGSTVHDDGCSSIPALLVFHQLLDKREYRVRERVQRVTYYTQPPFGSQTLQISSAHRAVRTGNLPKK